MLLWSKKYSFGGFLAGLVLVFLIAPFFEDDSSLSQLVRAGLSLLFLGSLWSLSERRDGVHYLSTALGLTFMVFSFSSLSLHDPLEKQWTMISGILFFGLMIYIFAREVFGAKQVDLNVILGSICIYVLMVVGWAFIYSLAQMILPNALFMPAPEQSSFSQMVYFSVVTITGLGYGDIYPLHPITKSLVGVQSMVGQLYLTIMIARLVGLHLADGQGDKVSA